MGTMNFSIPDDVKQAFNEAFEGENKSAIVAELLKRAVEDRKRYGTDEERKLRFEEALKRLEEMRSTGRSYSDEEIRRLREIDRP